MRFRRSRVGAHLCDLWTFYCRGVLQARTSHQIGLTLSLPLGRGKSVKLVARTGAVTSIGADFDLATGTHQFLW